MCIHNIYYIILLPSVLSLYDIVKRLAVESHINFCLTNGKYYIILLYIRYTHGALLITKYIKDITSVI